MPILGRIYGGLHDDDRIFKNLYGEGDWRLKDAMKRVWLFVFVVVAPSLLLVRVLFANATLSGSSMCPAADPCVFVSPFFLPLGVCFACPLLF